MVLSSTQEKNNHLSLAGTTQVAYFLVFIVSCHHLILRQANKISCGHITRTLRNALRNENTD